VITHTQQDEEQLHISPCSKFSSPRIDSGVLGTDSFDNIFFLFAVIPPQYKSAANINLFEPKRYINLTLIGGTLT
jgi:hypothetical protein